MTTSEYIRFAFRSYWFHFNGKLLEDITPWTQHFIGYVRNSSSLKWNKRVNFFLNVCEFNFKIILFLINSTFALADLVVTGQ